MATEDFFGELVAYAKANNITVRPHFNAPGHNILPRLGTGRTVAALHRARLCPAQSAGHQPHHTLMHIDGLILIPGFRRRKGRNKDPLAKLVAGGYDSHSQRKSGDLG